MEPTTFSLTLSPSGEAAPGLGILAAFVPAVDTYPAVGVISGLGAASVHEINRLLKETIA